MNNEYLMNEGCERLLIATQGSGVEFERFDDEHDGILVDDEDTLSFTTSIKVVPFMTDDGKKEPKPVTFQIDFDKEKRTYELEAGECNFLDITYGNVMAIMYFSAVT